jgi:hypothetical protein
MFENPVELGLQAQKNLRVDLIFDRDCEEAASKVAALVLKPKASWSTAKRDFASGEHSTWNCAAGVFLGYAMTVNEVKYLADGAESDGKLRSLPKVRLTREGTADKRMFFREPISVRKSLS